MENNPMDKKLILDEKLEKLLCKDGIGDKIEDFEIGKQIGKGNFGTVFEAKCLKVGYDGHHVAIKKLSKKEILKRNLKDRVISEIEIHRELMNSSILKFYTFFHDEKYVYLVLELCENETLEKYRKRKGCFNEEEARQIILQVIEGLRYLYTKKMMHRDFSTKNVLLTKDMKIKIADFGFSTKLDDIDQTKQTAVGTPYFTPPQVFQGEEYNIKIDCFAVGKILYDLLYGTTRNINKDKAKISCLVFPKYASDEAKELLSALLTVDQDKRISAKDILKMPFFAKYKKSEHASPRSRDSGMSFPSGSSALSSQSVQKSSRSTDSGFKNSTPTDFQNLQHDKYNSIPRSRDDHENKPHRNAPQMRKAPFVKGKKSKATSSSPKQHMSALPSHFDPSRQIIETCLLPNSQEMRRSHMSNGRLNSKLDDGPIPRHLVSPLPFPSHRLNYAEEENLGFNSCLTAYNTVDCSIQNSHSNEHCQKMPCGSSQDFLPKCSSCSNDFCCTSEVKCTHERFCNCRRHNAPGLNSRCNSYHSIKELEKEGIGGPRNDKSLKDIVQPLNTIRLLPRKHETKNAIVSLLNDGQVCMEFLKWRRDKKYVSSVWYISSDGLTIKLYKPKRNIEPSFEPHPLPNNLHEVQYFTFENLPKTHWKKYQSAKCFIDVVRSKTPKVTVYGKHCKCVMMENGPNPDFDARFYNGCMITEIRNKKTYTDQENRSADLTYESRLSNDIKKMYKVFTKMKKKCVRLHDAASKEVKGISDDEFSNDDQSCDEDFSDDDEPFPMIIGRRQYRMLQFQDTSKQNVSPQTQQSSVLIGPISAMKSYNNTMSSGYSPSQDSFRKGVPSSSIQKNTIAGIKSIFEIMKDVKELPKVVNGYIVVKYKDGIRMCSSLDGQHVSFYRSGDRLTNIEQNPQLMARVQWDLPGIINNYLLEANRTR